MTNFYSRVASASLIKESVFGTPLTPTTFFGLNDESIKTEYPLEPAQQVAGLRSLNLNPVRKAVPAPTGDIKINIEPNTFGHFLEGVYGGQTDGNYMPIVYQLTTASITGTPVLGATLLQATSLATATVIAFTATTVDITSQVLAFDASHVVTGTNPDGTTFTFTPSAAFPAGDFTVGETITGGSSSATAVVVIAQQDFLLVNTVSGTFTAGEVITGGTSTKTATSLNFNASVYGHWGLLPQNSMPSYTLQFNFQDNAVRYFGVYFTKLEVQQSNNIMTANVGVMCQQEFRHAKVTAITTAGSTKTITVDQTLGLVVNDTIKLWRPGADVFEDFSASSVKTNTVASIPSTTTFTVAALQVDTKVGDLIMLAPQTPSYSTVNELPFIGSTFGEIGTLSTTLVTADFEDFTYSAENAYEERHAATGNLPKDRFPAAIIQKGLQAKGSFKAYYKNEDMYRLLRLNTQQAFRIRTVSPDVIGASAINYEVRFGFARVLFDSFQTNIAKDAVVDQAVGFTCYHDTTTGSMARSLLVNGIASY